MISVYRGYACEKRNAKVIDTRRSMVCALLVCVQSNSVNDIRRALLVCALTICALLVCALCIAAFVVVKVV